jgi:DNA relaxase NicK
LKKKIKQVEKLHRQKGIRRMYQPVNDNRNEFKPYMSDCRDSIGMVLNELSENMEQWSQHFQNLLRPNVISMITQEMGEVEKNIERTKE